MDVVAAQYDFNDHALMRLTERIKDAVIAGILSPGKQGIWPASLWKEKMIDRRQFCYAIGAMLAGAMPGGGLTRYPAIEMEEAEPRLMVIYDARIPASCAFARSACRAGSRARIRGRRRGALAQCHRPGLATGLAPINGADAGIRSFPAQPDGGGRGHEGLA